MNDGWGLDGFGVWEMSHYIYRLRNLIPFSLTPLVIRLCFPYPTPFHFCAPRSQEGTQTTFYPSPNVMNINVHNPHHPPPSSPLIVHHISTATPPYSPYLNSFQLPLRSNTPCSCLRYAIHVLVRHILYDRRLRVVPS